MTRTTGFARCPMARPAADWRTELFHHAIAGAFPLALLEALLDRLEVRT